METPEETAAIQAEIEKTRQESEAAKIESEKIMAEKAAHFDEILKSPPDKAKELQEALPEEPADETVAEDKTESEEKPAKTGKFSEATLKRAASVGLDAADLEDFTSEAKALKYVQKMEAREIRQEREGDAPPKGEYGELEAEIKAMEEAGYEKAFLEPMKKMAVKIAAQEKKLAVQEAEQNAEKSHRFLQGKVREIFKDEGLSLPDGAYDRISRKTIVLLRGYESIGEQPDEMEVIREAVSAELDAARKTATEGKKKAHLDGLQKNRAGMLLGASSANGKASPVSPAEQIDRYMTSRFRRS